MKPKVAVALWLLVALLAPTGCGDLAPGLVGETPWGTGLGRGGTEQPSETGTCTPSPGSTPTVTPTSPPTAERTPSATATSTAAATPTATPTPTRPADEGARPQASPQATPRATPRVVSFAAVAHEVVELSWETTGDFVTICPVIDSRLVYCRCLYDLPPSGARVIEPEGIIGNYTGFELTAYAGAARATDQVMVDVRCPGHRDWFLENHPALCPEEGPLYSWAAAQRFENGLMIWVEDGDVYYIFYDRDLRVVDDSEGWSTLKSLQIVRGPLALLPGASPENRVEETPPVGRYEPVSGFGLVWRGEVMGTERVRERLGWALEPEYGYEAVYQCEAACGTLWNCYLWGPEGEVRHLTYLMHFGYYWE